jgi:voltage-gated potassium channel
MISAAFAGVVLLLSATGLYLAERAAQPDAFGSIPRALWVSVVTLTTVGYGDAYPITVPGRLFGALTALAGVALVAMPAGIFAAAFSDTFQRRSVVDD